MAGNLDLNVILSASFEKLKKGMADAVKVVKGGTKQMEEAAAGSKKALENALGGENLRVKRRELTQTINEQRSILTSFKQDLINLENKLAQTSKGDLMRQKALKNAIAGLKVEIKDQEQAVRQLSEARTEANFNLEEGSRRAEQNTQAMEAVSRAVNAASMATLLLAGDNKELSKVMRGVQVTMALASAAVAVYNLAQRENEIFTLASSKAQAIYAAAVGTSTGAMKAFRIALLATGVGIAIGLVAALASHFIDLADSADQAKGSVESWDKSLAKTAIGQEREKQLAALEAEGKTQKEIIAQKIKNAEEDVRLAKEAENRQKRGTKAATDAAIKVGEAETALSVLQSELAGINREEEEKKQKDSLASSKKYLEEKAKLQKAMEENLTKFLQDEEAKRLANLSARRRPREMTEADLMPAAPAAKPVGESFLMQAAKQNEEAANLDFEALQKWRENNADLFLAMQIRAAKMQQFALRMEVAAEQASAALANMSASMLESFAVLLGDAITGKADAMQTFLQSFASSLAGFLGTFGKALIAQGIAIDAFKESLKSLDPAVAIIAGVGLLTASALVKNAMAKGSEVQAFADGGIVSGPTLGLMGEYPGARSNPEVIAPLDKLQSMINTGQGGNFVASTKFDGRDLWLAINRYEKDKARG